LFAVVVVIFDFSLFNFIIVDMIQALSHEVSELKSEKMKIESGLVTSSDAGELAREKKVKSW